VGLRCFKVKEYVSLYDYVLRRQPWLGRINESMV